VRRLIIPRSTAEVTFDAGVGLVGIAIFQRIDPIAGAAAAAPAGRHAIPDGDIPTSYVALVCLDKSDYEAIDTFHKDPYLREALGLD